jgi:hypothetical protein
MNRVTQIVMYTLLAITSVAGLVVCGILFAVNDYSLIYIIGGLLGLGLIYLSIDRLIHANTAWKLDIIRAIREEGKDVITSWTIDKSDWSIYLNEQKARIKSITTTTTILAGAIVLVIYLFIARDAESSWTTLLANGLIGAVPLGLLIGSTYGLFQWKTIKKLSKDEVGVVYMAKEAILINDLIIIFQRKLFQSVSSAEILSDKAIPVINLTVKMKSLNKTNYQEHFIPFPVGRKQEAKKIIAFYLSEVEDSVSDDQEIIEISD